MADNRQSLDEYLASIGQPAARVHGAQNRPPLPFRHQVPNFPTIRDNLRPTVGRHPLSGRNPIFPPRFPTQVTMERYPDPRNIGQGFHEGFDPEANDFPKRVLYSYGYQLTNRIAYEQDNLHDNQVWIVKAIGSQNQYACKIASARYQYDLHQRRARSLANIDDVTLRLFKETDILKLIEHVNIIQLHDIIEIHDSETNFPFIFLAAIMEICDGTVLDLLDPRKPNMYPDGLPVEMASRLLRDMISAVHYLHYQIYDTVVCHRNIFPRNILFKCPKQKKTGELIHPLIIFKLADFEGYTEYELRNRRKYIKIKPDQVRKAKDIRTRDDTNGMTGFDLDMVEILMTVGLSLLPLTKQSLEEASDRLNAIYWDPKHLMDYVIQLLMSEHNRARTRRFTPLEIIRSEVFKEFEDQILREENKFRRDLGE